MVHVAMHYKVVQQRCVHGVWHGACCGASQRSASAATHLGVGDDEETLGVAREVLLQPYAGLEVQVVGRLVEQQQRRRREERLAIRSA